MSVRNINTDNKKSYRERRMSGRDRTAALPNEDKKPKRGSYDRDGKDGEPNSDGIGGENQAVNPPADNKAAKDHNLRREKGADLQQEQGAELATKNRLNEKPGDGFDAGSSPAYGNYIKNQKKYRKHAAKVNGYEQPYNSSLTEADNEPGDVKPDDAKTEKSGFEPDTGDTSSYAGTLYTSDSPIKANENQSDRHQTSKLSDKTATKLSEKSSKLERSESKPNLQNTSQSLKNTSQTSKLQEEPKKRLSRDDIKKSGLEPDAGDTSSFAGIPYTPDSPIKAHEKQSNKPQPSKLKPAVKLTEKSSKLEQRKNTPTHINTSQSPKLQVEPKKRLSDVNSRCSKVKEDGNTADGAVDVNIGDSENLLDGKAVDSASGKGSILKSSPKVRKPQTDNFKLGDGIDDMKSVDNVDKLGRPVDNQVKQKDFNRKKQYSQEHGKKSGGGNQLKPKQGGPYLNKTKSPKLAAKQHKLHDKAGKLMKKGSKQQTKKAENIAATSTGMITRRERVHNEAAGKAGKFDAVKTPEKHTLHQNETRWNNPKFTERFKIDNDVNGKAAVVGKAAAHQKGDVISTSGAADTIIGVDIGGVGSAPSATTLAQPTNSGIRQCKERIDGMKYGSKLVQNSIHRQVRKDIQQSNNEALQAVHWAEQKGERAVTYGVRKLNPTAIRRYIKNAPYRRESKLKIKKLENDKKLSLLRVKQDKASGVNHMTGKKSNAISRAWQKRQIKKNYQKAMIAAKGKGGDTFGDMARELARGNPKAIAVILAKKAALVMVNFSAKITVFNPIFWKLMAVALLFVLILVSAQTCVAMFSSGMAGFGIVSDEDISHSTRLYGEWEADMQLYLDSANIAAEFPPPASIASQPGVNGVVVYPGYPYAPPPPFYEYRFDIGMIRHDPMELISYLTARHGERFDEDSANPMTRADLEAILAEIFEAQYGVPPGEFDNLIHEEIETRFRIERRWEQVGTQPVIIGYDQNGLPIWGTEPVYGYAYHDVYYEFWILTVSLQPRSLSEVLRGRMTVEEQVHFDILVLTGNGRQIVGNPFDFNWLPNITSHYGFRVHPISNTKQMHMGIDIAAPQGTPIFATHTGTIAQVQFSDTGYGNMIRLSGEGMDGGEVVVLFAHLHEIHVTNGQEVTQGDLIATVGSTGDSTGPHLHLEVIRQNPTMHLNPLFAVITWTDDDGNENFRPLPGESG